jgi:sterol desaturase/sphingolipid hydroxylase (fatty acid hydroxylase superfamily)
MTFGLFADDTSPLEDASLIKAVAAVSLLALFWGWETWRPLFRHRAGRWRHAARNLGVALLNTAVMGLAFGAVTALVAGWAARSGHGLLRALDLPGPVGLALALVLLDGWSYLWHRANHAVPFLWRFHRTHHSDRHMDVTTATRFHVGEHVGSATLRLGLIPLLGVELWHVVAYEALVVAVTQFHHADVSLGRWDRWLRLVVVTPDMHKVHHSDRRPETDSNFSTVLSVWDRLAGTFRTRPDPWGIVFGLGELAGPSWQTVWGMLRTPFAPARWEEDPPAEGGGDESGEFCHVVLAGGRRGGGPGRYVPNDPVP